MNINQKENRIYFNENDTSYGNISIKEGLVKIELIRVHEKYRGRGLASKLLEKMIQYIKDHYHHVKIVLSPMPMSFGGTNESIFDLEQLIKFYKNHKFKESNNKTREEPYLMERYV